MCFHKFLIKLIIFLTCNLINNLLFFYCIHYGDNHFFIFLNQIFEYQLFIFNGIFLLSSILNTINNCIYISIRFLFILF